MWDIHISIQSHGWWGGLYNSAVLEDLLNFPFDFHEINSKVFIPFEINESIDTPLTEMDPDFQYYSTSNHTHGAKCDYYLEDQFISKVVEQKNCNRLSFFHLNVKSIPKHFDELEMYINSLKLEFTMIALTETWCDKLDRICQVGFAGAWHWPASGHSDAYCDVFDVCECVYARVNGGPDLVCVMEACLICVICVNCGIWNLGIYQLLRISGACNVCPSCVTGGELRSGVKCIVVTFVTGSFWL